MKIEIYADDMGGVWLLPVGYDDDGIAVFMGADPQPGGALTDCRLYGIDWRPEHLPGDVYSAGQVVGMAHVATYRANTDTLRVECDVWGAVADYIGEVSDA